MRESVKARKNRTTGAHTHIWVRDEVFKRVVLGPDTPGPGRAYARYRSCPPMYIYVCRCGETGMPVR